MTLLASHCFLNGRLHPVFLDVTNEKTSFSKNRLKFQQLPAFSFMKKTGGKSERTMQYHEITAA